MSDVNDVCGLPASEIARLVRERRLGAVEVLDAHLQQVAMHNPAVNAVISIGEPDARRRAIAADEATSRGESWGPLHGVPMTLKDAIDVEGLRSTIGTFELDHIAQRDSTIAARLRNAGAVIFGHSNVPGWLADNCQTSNPVFGPTRNPWDLIRTVGGSSGGAAAALAAGMTPIEVGSDMGGSIRLPAHFCGVYGLKTTEHRVPTTGFFTVPFDDRRSVRIVGGLGPMARSLSDIRLLTEILSGPDGIDTDVPPASDPYIECDLATMRLGVARTLPGATVHPELSGRVQHVADAIERAGGHIVDPPLPAIDWGESTLLAADLITAITGAFNPVADLRADQRTLAWYLAALHRRDAFISAWDGYFRDVDALICPAAMSTAFPHQPVGQPFVIAGELVDYGGHGALHVFANLAGLPALAVPAGSSADGLPIGIQLVGPRWSDLRLIAIAHAMEGVGVLPGFSRPDGLGD